MGRLREDKRLPRLGGRLYATVICLISISMSCIFVTSERCGSEAGCIMVRYHISWSSGDLGALGWYSRWKKIFFLSMLSSSGQIAADCCVSKCAQWKRGKRVADE